MIGGSWPRRMDRMTGRPREERLPVVVWTQTSCMDERVFDWILRVELHREVDEGGPREMNNNDCLRRLVKATER